MRRYPKRKQRGSTLLEFILAGMFFLVPLILGAMTVGMTLGRSIRVADLNRAAGHMFARGVDFSQASNRALLLRMANGLAMTDTGGQGVIMLSEIQCTSTGQAVCTRRFVIGNALLRLSRFTNPTSADANGNVDYAHDPGADAGTFLAVFPMSPGETTYVAEIYVSSADYDWKGLLGNGTYSTAIF